MTIGPKVQIEEIHHHPDGKIFVRTSKGTYSDTLENFAKDNGQSLPGLPAHARERIYRRGVVHTIQNELTVIDGGPMPWLLGDAIIESFDQLVAKQQAREKAEAEAKAASETPEQLAKRFGLPWPPRDLLKEFDALVARVEALEKK